MEQLDATVSSIDAKNQSGGLVTSVRDLKQHRDLHNVVRVCGGDGI